MIGCLLTKSFNRCCESQRGQQESRDIMRRNLVSKKRSDCGRKFSGAASREQQRRSQTAEENEAGHLTPESQRDTEEDERRSSECPASALVPEHTEM